MSAVATVYFLVALLAGDSPALAGLAGYETLEACQSAQAAISEQMANGTPSAQIVCLSGDDLQALAQKAQ